MDTWLSRVVGPPLAGERVLVLCRTQATLSRVRRWAVQQGRGLGLQLATPLELARIRAARRRVLGPEPLPAAGPPDVLPEHTQMGRRIGARPGLVGHARRWVQHVRAARRVGGTVAAPPWLDELVSLGWGRDEEEDAVLDMVSEPGTGWDRVVALGFDRPAGALAAWEPAFVTALTGRPPVPPPAPSWWTEGGEAGVFRALAVPDVVAEARVAARYASRDPMGTLVLVTEPTTARRLREALARNGLPCAWRDAEPLATHELAHVLQRAASWFMDAPDPAVQVADLAFVLTRTALQGLPSAAEAALARLLAPLSVPGGPPGRKLVFAAIERTRLLHAPLSRWRQRLLQLSSELAPSEPHLATTCAALGLRLEILRACLEARPLDEVLGELLGHPVPFDPDDFDRAVAELLGEAPAAPALPTGATLGALRRWLLELRVELHHDPVARALLASLDRHNSWPVTPSHLHQVVALSRDPGTLPSGVDVLLVDDWDGRPCRQLLVLDVHDHGLTRPHPPDPLLTDAEIEALGALTGRAAARERLLQLHRASSMAQQTLLLVSQRDAGGREVVPPIQLDLRYEDEPVPSYGWRLPGLLETERCVLEPMVGPPEAPAHPDPWVRHLATQATAEWYREGRGPALPGWAPAWVLPYLGHADGVPEAILPSDRPHSIPTLFGPLAHCAYQAFARAILGIREPTEVSVALDPPELADAVHRALEWVGPQARWRVPDSERETVRAELIARLTEATDRAFREALAQMGPVSATRRASAEGRRLRSNAYWPTYVASRTLAPPTPSLERLLEHHPLVPAAVAALREGAPATAGLPEATLRAWVIWAARTGPAALQRMAPDLLLRRGELGELPPQAAPHLPAVARAPALQELQQSVSDVVLRMEAWKRTPDVSVVEAPFGSTEPRGTVLDLGNAALKLGSQDVAISGRIDRIDLVTTPTGERLASVVDYRSGVRAEGYQFRRDQFTLRDPHLLLYAMVIERAGRGDELPEAFRRVRAAVVAHDRVDHSGADPERAGHKPMAPETWIPLDRRLLGWAARQLGALVDEARQGRWPLRPRADACPMMTQGTTCPVAGACRLRRP
jgi:RecB family exonuclease